MKIVGIRALIFASSCCRSRPLNPGRFTSSTRQPGPLVHRRVKNSWAEPKVSTFSPIERTRWARLSRTDTSSSMTTTTGRSSLIVLLASRSLQGRFHRVQEFVVAKGFVQESHGAGFKGCRSRVVVGIGRDEDDGKSPVGRHNVALQLESVHARHPHVQNQTLTIASFGRAQKRFSRGEAERLESGRSDQTGERKPVGIVIVNNRDE